MKFLCLVLGLLFQLTAGDVVLADESNAVRPTLSGRVIDESGRPLTDVRVDISTAAPKVGRGIFCPSCYLDCSKWATTDKAGRFELKDLDRSLKFRLLIATPGRKTVQTKLMDPEKSPVDVTLDPLPPDIDPSRIVSGTVKQNGLPVAGALVHPHGARTVSKRWWGTVKNVNPTVTDSSGHFAIVLPTEMLALDIQVTGHGFCGVQVPLIKPGGEPAEIEVFDGARVSGQLVRKGRPVAGMSIAVVQTDRGSSADRIFIAAVGEVTDRDGKFEFRHLPPDEQYCIYSLAGDAKRTQSDFILSAKIFRVSGSGETRDLGALEVEEPISIKGRIERVDGRPLPDKLQLSFGRDPAWDLIGIPVEHDGTFEAGGLPPETYEIRVGSRDFVLVAERTRYQLLDESSFGINVRESIDDLVISVKGK